MTKHTWLIPAVLNDWQQQQQQPVSKSKKVRLFNRRPSLKETTKVDVRSHRRGDCTRNILKFFIEMPRKLNAKMFVCQFISNHFVITSVCCATFNDGRHRSWRFYCLKFTAVWVIKVDEKLLRRWKRAKL